MVEEGGICTVMSVGFDVDGGLYGRANQPFWLSCFHYFFGNDGDV